MEAIKQFWMFQGIEVEKPTYKTYPLPEPYVPTPEMIRQLLARVRGTKIRACLMLASETGASLGEIFQLTWKDVNLAERKVTIRGIKGHRSGTYQISNSCAYLLSLIPKNEGPIWKVKFAKSLSKALRYYRNILYKETGNPDYLKIHFHTLRHFAISWYYFKTKDIVATQRFARHCDIKNTLRYVHLAKTWYKENEFVVIYAQTKEELTKSLQEGYELVAKTEWGYCLRKPKSMMESY
ncbi:MAG: tyrosine-type recombinase/integrase [Candidatus Bathyarchaeia archaeon]